MKHSLHLLFLSGLLLSSCEKKNGGIIFDTHIDAIVINRQQEDLLAGQLDDQTDYFDLASLKIIDASTGKPSDIAPDRKSYVLLSPEGGYDKYRLRVYLNSKLSSPALYLHWGNGNNIDTLAGKIESVGDTHFCTEVSLNGKTVWTQSEGGQDRVITLVKSKQTDAHN